MFKKIKNNNGITILHALVGLLVFTAIGTIIYSSSIANLKDFKRQQAFQQAYLTVSSAATTFAKSFEGDAIEHRVTEYKLDDSGKFTKEKEEWVAIDANLENPLFQSTGSDTFNFTSAYANGGNGDYQFIINAENKSKILETVICDIKMRGYTIFANFYIVNNNYEIKSGVDNYIMSVTIPIFAVDEDDPYTVNTSDTVKEGDNIYNATTTTYRYEIDTANIVIAKGAVSID